MYGGENSERQSVVVPLSDSLKIFKQIQWIARGIPELTKLPLFKAQVETDLTAAEPSYFVSNRDLQTSCSSIVHYKNGVSSNNLGNFSPNEYDSSFFFEIEYNGCVMSVGLTSPDIDVQNKNLPHLIVPTDPLGIKNLPYYGYRINGSGNIDSVWLDDDDIESYYIWWVVAEDHCFTTRLQKKEEAHCGNNKCEFWLGENKNNCTDCTEDIIKGKVLMILGVITGTDKKNFSTSHPNADYQEWHYKGKYELGYNYSIEDNNSSIYSSHFGNRQGGVTYLTELTSWVNNCDIKRSKLKNNGSTKTNRGISKTLFNDSVVLFTNFDRNMHDIYFNLHEVDRHKSLTTTWSTFTNNFPLMTRGHSYTFNNPKIGNQSPVTGVSGQRAPDNQILYIKHDVITTPASSIWKGPVTIGSFTGDTLVVPLDGEIKVIFGIR